MHGLGSIVKWENCDFAQGLARATVEESVACVSQVRRCTMAARRPFPVAYPRQGFLAQLILHCHALSKPSRPASWFHLRFAMSYAMGF